MELSGPWDGGTAFGRGEEMDTLPYPEIHQPTGQSFSSQSVSRSLFGPFQFQNQKKRTKI